MSEVPPPRRIGPGMTGLLSALVYLSLPLVPLAGVFLALVAPLPLLQMTSSGRPSFVAWGWVAVVASGAVFLTSSLWLALLALGYLTFTVWPAVSVESSVRYSWSSGRWFAILVLGGLAIALVSLTAVLAPAFPPSFLARVLTATVEQGGIPAWLFGGHGGKPEVTTALQLVAYFAPAIVALYLLAVGSFVHRRLALLGVVEKHESFCDYRSEEWLPVGFILGGLGWVFLPEPGKWLAANLLASVGGLYFRHGLAIIHFYLGPRLRSNRWVRAGVLLLALQMPVAVCVAATGLMDAFVRLRRGEAADGGSSA